MDLHLTGKIPVVTGAGKGIGSAVTRAPAAEGVQALGGGANRRHLWSTRWRWTSARRTGRAGNVSGADFTMDGGLVTTL
jgi:NADP-dependent 3-hydroxy acid dehydrogenase YdfG